jgi:hypothetical protein
MLARLRRLDAFARQVVASHDADAVDALERLGRELLASGKQKDVNPF